MSVVPYSSNIDVDDLTNGSTVSPPPSPPFATQGSQPNPQALLNTPSQPTTDESTNWSGDVQFASPGESFGTISAQWVVPAVSQVPISGITTTDMAEWVGIDGYNSTDVCQAGVMEVVQTSGGQTTISCEAWIEWYPAYAIDIPASVFAVNPGNTISVAVETRGAGATSATFVLDNETTGQIYETSLTAPSGTSLQGNSAEAIVETPDWVSGNQVSQPLLTDFLNSPVVFTDVASTYSNGATASLSSAQSIGMWTDEVPGTNGYVQEAYGSIQPASDSVRVTEDNYWGGPSDSISLVATSSDAVQGGSAVYLSLLDPTIVDPSSTTLTSATVKITNGSGLAIAGDELSVAGQQSGTITGIEAPVTLSWNNTTDTLTITGTASIAEYEFLLSEVQYQDTGTDTTTGGHPVRTVTWSLNDGTTIFGTTSTVDVDRAPVANNVAASDSTGATVATNAATGVLANDSDPDRDTLTVAGVVYGAHSGTVGQALAGAYGTLTLNANGSYSYVASNTAAINAVPPSSTLTDTFTYTVSDGHGGATSASLTITIDRPPVVAASNAVLSAGGTTVAASSLFTASDPNGSTITSYQFVDTGPGEFLLNGVAQPNNQDITVTAAQLSQLTYEGMPGAAADTVEIRASDGTAWGNWASFTVTPPPLVIEAAGATSLVENGGDYFLNPAAGGAGPELKVNGQPFASGQEGGWNPIAAEPTASGYEVALYLASQNLYTMWETDSNANYISDTTGAVAATSYALESLEPSFHQDLNGDGTIGPTTSLVHANGSIQLLLAAGTTFVLDAPGITDLPLQYGGMPVTAGEFSGWAPIGAVQTASGYDVAFEDASAGLYSVWTLNSSGVFDGALVVEVPGTNLTLEAVETTFGQDLNGDGTIGLVSTTVKVDGSTSLLQSGSDYLLEASGDIQVLQYGGMPVTAGEFSGWAPIGAIQTGTGFDVAFEDASAGFYSVWTTDSNGVFNGALAVQVSGNNPTLESLETTFGQDLNGDGTIGLVSTTIKVDGSTSLLQSGSDYLLDAGGNTEVLQYGGMPVTAGEFLGWAPIGAVQTASGFDVAMEDASAGFYSVWTTDSNGVFNGALAVQVSGNNPTLESLETTFGQDLNGDGTIGLVSTTIKVDGSTSLLQSGSNYLLNVGGNTEVLQYGGMPVTAGEFSGWAPIGAIQTGTGFDVAFENVNASLYSVWTTDSSGVFNGALAVQVSGNNPTLESLETTFGQDLNGDGTIGLVSTTIQTDGTTTLAEAGNNYFLDVSGMAPTELQYGGAPVTAGEFPGWAPIGAVQTASGFDVAMEDASAGLYSIWTTDSAGHFNGALVVEVPASNPTLIALESVFGQDFNGNDVIGMAGSGTEGEAGTTIVAVWPENAVAIIGISGEHPATFL